MMEQSAVVERALNALRAVCIAEPNRHSSNVPAVQAIPSDNPAGWDTDAGRQDFSRWRAERCVHRKGREDWGGVGRLLVDFAEWRAAHDAAPATRRVFERLLFDVGVEVQNGLARGLVLKVDLEAVDP